VTRAPDRQSPVRAATRRASLPTRRAGLRRPSPRLPATAVHRRSLPSTPLPERSPWTERRHARASTLRRLVSGMCLAARTAWPFPSYCDERTDTLLAPRRRPVLRRYSDRPRRQDQIVQEEPMRNRISEPLWRHPPIARRRWPRLSIAGCSDPTSLSWGPLAGAGSLVRAGEGGRESVLTVRLPALMSRRVGRALRALGRAVRWDRGRRSPAHPRFGSS
jgi:hypothetical protein